MYSTRQLNDGNQNALKAAIRGYNWKKQGEKLGSLYEDICR